MSNILKGLIVVVIFVCLALDFASIVITQRTIGYITDIVSIHQTVLERQKKELDELASYNNQLTKLWFEVTSIAITTHLKLNILKNSMDKDETTKEN